jgi:hypothetical protein
MTEKDRSKALFLLLQKLISQEDKESISLLKTFVDNDTESIKKTFQVMISEDDHLN